MLYKHVKYIAVALAGGACCSAVAQNMLSNPGFENNPTNCAPWTQWEYGGGSYGYQYAGTSGYFINTTDPYAGAQALNVTNNYGWPLWWSAIGIVQTAPFSPSLGYTLSGHLKNNGGIAVSSATLRVKYMSAATNELLVLSQGGLSVPSDGAYHLLSADFAGSPPSATTWIKAELVIGTGSGFNVLLDEFSLTARLPAITNVSLSGGNVILRGNNGVEGTNYVVWQTTNMSLPLASWTARATNLFGSGGTFSCTNPVAGGSASFYRIGPISVPPITLSPATVPDGKVGDVYGVWYTDGTNWYRNDVFITADGGAPPYTFALTAGTLPTGLTLNSSGLISGTNTVTTTNTFTVKATDYYGRTNSQSFTLSVPFAPITVLPETIPNGQVGVEYGSWWTDGTYWYRDDVFISANGGRLMPYTYAVTVGTLPAGLSLNATTGLLSGTNTVSGTNTFTVTATDATSLNTGTRAYTVEVP